MVRVVRSRGVPVRDDAGDGRLTMGMITPLFPLPPGLPPEAYAEDLERIRQRVRAAQVRLLIVLTVGIAGLTGIAALMLLASGG